MFLSKTSNSATMSQQNEKITHIKLNDDNNLPWVHIVTIELGGRSKLKMSQENYQNQYQQIQTSQLHKRRKH
jgi:hypothetical protein